MQHKPKETRCTVESQTTSEPTVMINFNGVLVGRHDPRAHIFEVGVFPSPEHTFYITVEEIGPLTRNTSTISLNEIDPADRIWTLEVEDRPLDATIPVFNRIPNRTVPPTMGTTEAQD